MAITTPRSISNALYSEFDKVAKTNKPSKEKTETLIEIVNKVLQLEISNPSKEILLDKITGRTLTVILDKDDANALTGTLLDIFIKIDTIRIAKELKSKDYTSSLDVKSLALYKEFDNAAKTNMDSKEKAAILMTIVKKIHKLDTSTNKKLKLLDKIAGLATTVALNPNDESDLNFSILYVYSELSELHKA